MIEIDALIPFEFDGSQVRVVDHNGDPWFIARDVATALGYTNTRRAVKMHCPRRCPVGGSKMDLPLDPKTLIIPDSDVYRLATRSHLPSAARFEKWIMEEVLPSIRKTGSYALPQTTSNQEVARAPERTAREILADPRELQHLLLDMTQRYIDVKERVEELEPQAKALDRISTAQGSLCITDAAKTLQVRPLWLFNWLNRERWIYRRPFGGNWVAYQQKIIDGHLEHKVTTITRADGAEKISEQVRVTPAGLAMLAKMLEPPRDGVAQASLPLPA